MTGSKIMQMYCALFLLSLASDAVNCTEVRKCKFGMNDIIYDPHNILATLVYVKDNLHGWLLEFKVAVS